ncbi:MAG: hypothetical protein ABSB67_12005 [Bryobacteraceae bacterium]|jgi:hypothetical protein
MKYWAYLGAKLAVAGVFLYGLWYAVLLLLLTFDSIRAEPIVGYIIVVILVPLLGFAVLALIVRDQWYRCRTCGRRMRMPLEKGSLSHLFLRDRPRMEYICIYGHGTLKVPEERVSGSGASDWQPHSDDIWKELEHSTREQ